MKCEVIDPKHIGLAWNFHVNPSSCANPDHYENYLRLCAINEKNEGLNVTHVFIEDDENGSEHICGYITLKATAFIREDDGVKLGFPALEISELAVDASYEGKGLGTTMVKYAFIHAEELHNSSIGVQYITLCADPSAVSFYKRPELGFAKIGDYEDVPREGWNKTCTPMFMRMKYN